MHTDQRSKTTLSRRRYLRTSLLVAGLGLGITTSTPVAAEPPRFLGRIYADNELWATRGVADLPLPNGKNNQSYDKLFPSPGTDLLAVAEAAPGNRHYNGGRWAVHPLTWHDDPEQLTSYESIKMYADAGKLSYPEEAVDAFECPLVPVDE